MTFIIQPGSDYKMYLEVAVRDDKKRFWFQIVPGEGEPKENSKDGTEFLVYVPGKKVGKWRTITLDVVKTFDQTFKKNGLSLHRIEGVRLRGKLTIAKIVFE